MDIDTVLGLGGPFAQTVPGFVPRPQQLELARAVEQAIVQRQHLIAEAGTGTGKTFAYLAPALLSGARVIISTGTKALQDQLYFRDLPVVRRALGSKARCALLKGRANYLCLYRLDRTQREGRLSSRQEVEQFKKIRTFAAKTLHGDRAECADVPEDAPIWAHVTSTIDNCLGSSCAFFEDCHLVKARRRAMEADVVVVNHYLLFADMAVKLDGFGEVLPGAQAFVIDEAHQLVEAAGSFFAQSLSLRQLTELGKDALAEAATASGVLPKVQADVAALGLSMRKLRAAMAVVPAKGHTSELLEHAEIVTLLSDLAAQLSTIAALFESLGTGFENLLTIAERATALRDMLALTTNLSDSAMVCWYEVSRFGFSLHATPLDVAGPLSRYREQSKAAWILTSATLAVGDSFRHSVAETGFYQARELLLGSPFDYANQALMYLPSGLPEPSQFGYTDAVVEAVLPVLEASKGRAFLLFTSHRALKLAADLLESRCDFPLFVQGEMPRSQLLERFRASGNGVLLGAASFWEGVDVKGEALSLVVIDKLPFSQIGEPVIEARLSQIRERGGHPFSEHQLPEAVIALKQGAGRLIRDGSDRGVLMLCDPRLRSKSYGKTFLNSLPPMPVTQSLEAVQAFFATIGSPMAERD